MQPTMPASCPHCSGNGQQIFHGGTCPRIRAIEYYEDGRVKRVEFHGERELEKTRISKPGAEIEVFTIKIPEAVQAAISANLDAGRSEV